MGWWSHLQYLNIILYRISCKYTRHLSFGKKSDLYEYFVFVFVTPIIREWHGLYRASNNSTCSSIPILVVPEPLLFSMPDFLLLQYMGDLQVRH